MQVILCKTVNASLNVGATSRVSMYLYNDESDIDALIAGLHKVRSLLPYSWLIAMSSLDDLYREIILDHYRSQGIKELAPPAHRCGGSMHCVVMRSLFTFH